MKFFFKKETFSKRVSGWVAYPVLALFSFTVVWVTAYFYVPRALSVGLPYTPRPYEGKIASIEYNCLCSGSIMLTIKPTTSWGLTNQDPSMNLMYYWAAEVLSQIADIPGPRIYAFWQIFYPGDQQLLGLYYPYQVPCVAYAGSACTVTGYAQGVLMTTGTSTR